MIQVKLNKASKCNGEYSLYLKFNYNPDIVNKIRDLPIRYWNAETKEWEIPFKYFSKLKSIFDGYSLNVPDYDEIKKLQVLEAEQINYIPNNYKFKINPFKHQIDGVNFGLKYDKFVLGDEQGLGKTMQAINIATLKKLQKGYKHCLIICGVNGLKWNWQAEIEKHSNERGYILGTRYDKKGKPFIACSGFHKCHYVKPEENQAYYVMNGEFQGSFFI